MFPLTSALHVKAGLGSADSAVGHVLTVASLGQIAGHSAPGAIA